MSRTAFDTDRYIRTQRRAILDYVQGGHEKLYIEFGGKMLEDRHAARVMPGFEEDAKFRILESLIPGSAAILVVSARDIMRGRIRGDFRIAYDEEVERLLAALDVRGFRIEHVAISRLDHTAEPPERIRALEEQLRESGRKPYRFYEIEEYTADGISQELLAQNPFIRIDAPIVGILSPGGGSGKFGVCLAQLYQEMRAGIRPRYLKFETFPVHDLPLDHPLHLAFMAASADFHDSVKKDLRHGNASSYNRDLHNYELLHRLARMFGDEGACLREIDCATNMGVNCLTSGILDDEVIRRESSEEVRRRVARYEEEVAAGKEDPATLARAKELLGYL